MNDRLFLKPAPGLTVRKPVGQYLAEEGEWVPDESYWRRRLTDGDVVQATAPAEPAPAPADADAAAAPGKRR